MRLTEKDKAFIRQHYGKMSDVEIADAIGCNARTVKFWADRLCLSRAGNLIDAMDGGQFLRKNIATMSNTEIAEHYGCNPFTVSRYIRKNGITAMLPASLVVGGTAYRRAVANVHVSRDGAVLHNGKPIKSNRRFHPDGHRQTAYICITEKGKKAYYQLSRLVAKAWLHRYTDDSYILYKDGDIHNVTADNLICASEKSCSATAATRVQTSNSARIS